MMKSLRRRWSGVAVVAAAVALAASQAGAQVMSQVPEGAMVVLKVANLQKTSGKIASLSQKMGIAQMLPQLQDPMAALKQKMHDPKGLNEQGDMAFVYMNPDAAGGDKEKALLVLLPVADYQAFLGNLQGAKTEGDVTAGRLQDSQDMAYVAHWGDYAAMSPAKEIVANKPAKMLAPAGVTAKELDAKDIVVYANFAQIRTKAVPALQQYRQKALAMLERRVNAETSQPAAEGGANATAPAAQGRQAGVFARAMAEQWLNIVQEFLQDTQAATWGINLADDGIKSSLVAEFEGNSYLGQLASASKNTDQSLMKGLPAGGYLLFGGFTVNQQQVVKFIDDVSASMVKDVTASGGDTAALQKYLAANKQFWSNANTVSLGVAAPTGGLGQEALIQWVGVVDGKADQLDSAVQSALESVPAVAKSAGVPEENVKFDLASNAKTVGGVPFTHLQAHVNVPANDPRAAQLTQGMTLMLGPDGANLYAGKADDQHMVLFSGANDELVGKVVTAVKANADELDKQEHLKAVNAQLPANRIAVFYVPLDNLVMTGVNYAKQFGMPIQVQLPPNLPPIGAALASEGSAYRVDGYLSAQLVQSLVSAGMQAFMAMQGGGGGGGGAQPGGPGGL